MRTTNRPHSFLSAGICCMLLILASCVDPAPVYHAFSLELVVDFGEDVPEEHRKGAKLVLSNLTKNYSLTRYTGDSGRVSFQGIEPGFYSATILHSFSHRGKSYHINGLQNVDVFSDLSDTLDIVLSQTSAFVIKQYYYSACLTPAGKQYSSDQFIEIHNNSEQLQYIDRLALVEHESYAIEENYWKDIEDTIVARAIWTIPGDGDDYPLAPGESVVIARDGINHQDPEYGNPLSPVNLEFADFEFWVKHENGSDLDAPHADNMLETLFTFRGSDYVFHTRGGSAIALALYPGTQEEWQDYIDHHLVLKLNSSTRYYARVPNEYILDAVEVTWDEAHAIYKRFPPELDAGYTYVASGSRSGLCVRRKVEAVVDGRFIYQDTNNSTEDFEKDVLPKPWINEE
ncbi:MAG: hypothetical protein CSA96_06845 [Bacteroidetes bacterium]|nr:MAG: hypothetical protein CSA96_06845 [Bacteroidota bacterium]